MSTISSYTDLQTAMLEQWLNEEYAKGNVNLRLFSPEFDKLIARKLQDPDWRFLRVDAQSHFSGWSA